MDENHLENAYPPPPTAANQGVNSKIKSAKKNSNRRNNPKYTPEEDNIIRNYVQQYGDRRWKNCAQWLPGRDGSSCRDRWVNYLSRDDHDVEFSTEQDELLLQVVEVNGTQWAYIRDNFFLEFTDVDLKNHYNKLKRRGNKVQHAAIKKPPPKIFDDVPSPIFFDDCFYDDFFNQP